MGSWQLENLKERLARYKDRNKATPTKPLKNASLAFNIAVEIVAGIIVGTIIGLFLDKIFASSPAFLIICLILSGVAAFRSIWKKYVK